MTIPYFVGVATHDEIQQIETFRNGHVKKIIFFDMPSSMIVMDKLRNISVQELIMFASVLPRMFQFAEPPSTSSSHPPPPPAYNTVVPPHVNSDVDVGQRLSIPSMRLGLGRGRLPSNDQPPAYFSAPMPAGAFTHSHIRGVMYHVDVLSEDDEDVTDYSQSE